MNQKITGIALMSLCLATACRKDTANPPHPPVNDNPRIAIKLNEDYLPAEKVDSAILTWDINGQQQEERMQLSHDTLFLETAKLVKGNGRLTQQVFSKLSLRQRNL